MEQGKAKPDRTGGGPSRQAHAPGEGNKIPAGDAYRHRRILYAELTQVLYILVGLGLGMTVPRIRRGPDLAAQQVIGGLTTIGLGALGLVAIIYSLGILVVRSVASNYSPRLTFRDTPIPRQTFAFALGVTVFCVSAPSPSAPSSGLDGRPHHRHRFARRDGGPAPDPPSDSGDRPSTLTREIVVIDSEPDGT